MTVNTDAYLEFVDAVTSEQSKDFEALVYRLQELEGQEFPSERLLTAAVGMSAEAGEFTEIVKKIIFQGKPVNDENMFHMKRELGDIMWYVAQACMGLNVSLDEVIEMNVDKLKVTISWWRIFRKTFRSPKGGRYLITLTLSQLVGFLIGILLVILIVKLSDKISELTKLKKEVKRGICRIYEELGRIEIARQKDRQFFNREISKIYDKL